LIYGRQLALTQLRKANRHCRPCGERPVPEDFGMQPDSARPGKVQRDVDLLSHCDRRTDKEHSAERQIGAQSTKASCPGFDGGKDVAGNSHVSSPERVATNAESVRALDACPHAGLHGKQTETYDVARRAEFSFLYLAVLSCRCGPFASSLYPSTSRRQPGC